MMKALNGFFYAAFTFYSTMFKVGLSLHGINVERHIRSPILGIHDLRALAFATSAQLQPSATVVFRWKSGNYPHVGLCLNKKRNPYVGS